MKIRKSIIIAAAVIAIVAAVLFVPSQTRLTIRHDGRLIFTEKIASGGTFSIRYNHSVNRSPVVDTIEYTPNATKPLTVRTSLYQTFGAGIPVAEDGGILTATEDGLLLSGIDTVYDKIDLMTGTYADHHLITQSGEHQLKALCGEQKHVVIRVGRVSPADILFCYLTVR